MSGTTPDTGGSPGVIEGTGNVATGGKGGGGDGPTDTPYQPPSFAGDPLTGGPRFSDAFIQRPQFGTSDPGYAERPSNPFSGNIWEPEVDVPYAHELTPPGESGPANTADVNPGYNPGDTALTGAEFTDAASTIGETIGQPDYNPATDLVPPEFTTTD